MFINYTLTSVSDEIHLYDETDASGLNDLKGRITVDDRPDPMEIIELSARLGLRAFASECTLMVPGTVSLA